MKQSRFKSPVFWTALVAQVISIGQIAGLWAKWGIDTGMIGDIAAGILQIGVLFGLLNDPTTQNHF